MTPSYRTPQASSITKLIKLLLSPFEVVKPELFPRHILGLEHECLYETLRIELECEPEERPS
jgi:hypothetical protein